MGVAPFSQLRSKLNRAICAYLVSQNCGSVANILPANSQKPKTYPNVTVHSTRGIPEPPLTGNYRITVHISIKGSAAQPKDEPNPEFARTQFDNLVGNVFDALMQSDDGFTLRATATSINTAGRALATTVDNSSGAAQVAANNADMVDFTCIGWFDMGFGDGLPDEEGCSWEEILIFDALCCASNVD